MQEVDKRMVTIWSPHDVIFLHSYVHSKQGNKTCSEGHKIDVTSRTHTHDQYTTQKTINVEWDEMAVMKSKISWTGKDRGNARNALGKMPVYNASLPRACWRGYQKSHLLWSLNSSRLLHVQSVFNIQNAVNFVGYICVSWMVLRMNSDYYHKRQ
jgi:hypothetical protein